MQVSASDLIRKCRVINYFSLSVDDFDAYLNESPYHFYVQYAFPKLQVTRWNQGKRLNGRSKRPEICVICWREDKQKSADFKEFSKTYTRRPLRTFDPFGGVGAFALSMQEAGCLKLTHAAEIAPSAALTLQYVFHHVIKIYSAFPMSRLNSPETKVLNQCSNLLLEEAVKRVRIPNYTGRPKHPFLSLPHGSLSPLPEPPTRGDIDCIVAGFPWSVVCSLCMNIC